MDKEGKAIYRSTLVAFLILISHVFLIAGIGCLVLFFRGITQYMMWILLAIGILILASGYLFYRRMKKERNNLSEMMNSSHFKGKSVEVSFLGGFAKVRIGDSDSGVFANQIEYPEQPQMKQIEDSAGVKIRELTELARLLENEMITLEEYNKTKQQLFNSYDI